MICFCYNSSLPASTCLSPLHGGRDLRALSTWYVWLPKLCPCPVSLEPWPWPKSHPDSDESFSGKRKQLGLSPASLILSREGLGMLTKYEYSGRLWPKGCGWGAVCSPSGQPRPIFTQLSSVLVPIASVQSPRTP